jgi:hypothetical protein
VRAYDPAMAAAEVQFHSDGSEQGAATMLITWKDHVIEAIGIDAPVPPEALGPCLQLSHYAQATKERVRAHRSHYLLWEVGGAEPLERYVALAGVCGALTGLGALAVLNEAAQTTLPAAVFEKSDEHMLAVLRALPLPMLYCGFAKYEVEGMRGVWMRTWAAHTMGLPDLALFAAGHDRGQETMELFENVLRYVYDSGAELDAGHTMQVGEDTFARLRSPRKEEYFLESPGKLLVVTLAGSGVDSWPGPP